MNVISEIRRKLADEVSLGVSGLRLVPADMFDHSTLMKYFIGPGRDFKKHFPWAWRYITTGVNYDNYVIKENIFYFIVDGQSGEIHGLQCVQPVGVRPFGYAYANAGAEYGYWVEPRFRGRGLSNLSRMATDDLMFERVGKVSITFSQTSPEKGAVLGSRERLPGRYKRRNIIDRRGKTISIAFVLSRALYEEFKSGQR